jgi:cytochrome c-type biogenesis protein
MSVSTVIALFGAGVASFFAPCVFPLVPAYLGVLAGEASQDGMRPRSAVVPTLAFVGGFSAVFVGLGVVAGGATAWVGETELWVERGGGLVLMALGLASIGARHRRLGRSWQPLTGLGERVPRPFAPLAIGVAFGAAWTPCVGPLLGAALVIAAQTHGRLAGAGLLAAYSLGVGAPFLAVSLLLSAVAEPLRRLKTAARPIHMAASAFLILLGLLLASGRYSHFVSLFNPTKGI